MTVLFAVFGFLVCVAVVLAMTATWVVVAMNTLGKWNIGGVPNTWKDRTVTIAFLAFIVWEWYVLFSVSPFTITITAP